MRHLYGFLLALAMSAALFFGGGLGVWRIVTQPAVSSASGLALTGIHGALPLAALLGTGLLLGILLTAPRVSPLSTGLPGLVLLGWSALLVLRGRYALRFVPLPASHFGAGISTMLSSGVLGLLGALMLIPLLRPARWRGADRYDEDIDDEDVPAVLGLVP